MEMLVRDAARKVTPRSIHLSFLSLLTRNSGRVVSPKTPGWQALKNDIAAFLRGCRQQDPKTVEEAVNMVTHIAWRVVSHNRGFPYETVELLKSIYPQKSPSLLLARSFLARVSELPAETLNLKTIQEAPSLASLKSNLVGSATLDMATDMGAQRLSSLVGMMVRAAFPHEPGEKIKVAIAKINSDLFKMQRPPSSSRLRRHHMPKGKYGRAARNGTIPTSPLIDR